MLPRGDLAVELTDVTFVRDARAILDRLSLRVRRGEQWALLGPNGAGKSTLLGICGAMTFPSRGTARVLGHRMGEVDLRELRASVGRVDPRHPLRSDLSLLGVVLTGATGTHELVPRWTPDEATLGRAHDLLATVGLDASPAIHWHTMSQGERGRALIARALLPEPPLLLLDEPSTGLDLAAREQLLQVLADLPDRLPGLTSLTVTHHLEELAPSTSHAALLRDGRLLTAGPVDDVLTSARVSECFAHPVEILRRRGRWTALAG